MKHRPSILWLLGCPLVLTPAMAAQRSAPKPVPPVIQSSALPLRDVVLFSSGVGYFGRAGRINGNAAFDLAVRAPQLADILKSLVLLDPGGTVQPVGYSVEDWMQQRPRETDLQINASASPGSLLRGFQGAVVRLQRAGGPVQGRVVSVSSKQVKVGKDWNTVDVVTLLTTVGLETIRLDGVSSFRLVDPALDAKLRASLKKLASGMTARLDDGTRRVSMHFSGTGPRQVRAGYLLETPVWKATYRLVLNPGQQPYIQGWAIVENTSNEDWKGVRLTLVSGRPVSFVQDLSTPLYVARPVVPPSVQGSAKPQTFGAGYGSADGQAVLYAKDDGAAIMDEEADSDARDARREQGPAGPAGPSAPRNSKRARVAVTPGILHRNGAATYIDSLADSINRADMAGETTAQGSQRGELFAYALQVPLHLPRGRAALVPFFAGDIAGDAVSIAVSDGQSVGELAPSNGFALRNNSGAQLQGGPVSVYQGGIYGGDALIGNVSLNETRLLTYASDLDLLARLDKFETSSKLLKLSAANGNLVGTYGYSRVRTFNLKNKNGKAKTVILQIPNDSSYELEDPAQLTEKSTDGLRFRVNLSAREQREYVIRSKTTGTQALLSSNLSADQITAFLRETSVSTGLKAALQEVLNKRANLTALAARREKLELSLRDIESDQSRIRSNMERISSESALRKIYVEKLTAQEVRVDKLRDEIAMLRDEEAEVTKSLRDFVNGLNIE